MNMGLLVHVGTFRTEMFVEERDSWTALLSIGNADGPCPTPAVEQQLNAARASSYRRVLFYLNLVTALHPCLFAS